MSEEYICAQCKKKIKKKVDPKEYETESWRSW